MALTGVTAASKARELQIADEGRKPTAEPALLFFRRMIDLSLHEAHRTNGGLPTPQALLEYAWIESHSEPGRPDWLTSFEHCCRMLALDAASERRKALDEIDAFLRKALLDWGRKKRQAMLENIHELKAQDNNPAWLARQRQGWLEMETPEVRHGEA